MGGQRLQAEIADLPGKDGFLYEEEGPAAGPPMTVEFKNLRIKQ